MAGWQWAFVLTGILGFIAAGLIFFLLPDWPNSPQTRRSIFSVDEGEFMVARLPPTTSRSTDANFDWHAIGRELRTPLLCPSPFKILLAFSTYSVRRLHLYQHLLEFRPVRCRILVADFDRRIRSHFDSQQPAFEHTSGSCVHHQCSVSELALG